MMTLKKHFCCDGERAGAYETLQLATTDEVVSHLPILDGYMHPQDLGEILTMSVLHPDHARYEMHFTIVYVLEGLYPEVESVVQYLTNLRRK